MMKKNFYYYYYRGNAFDRKVKRFKLPKNQIDRKFVKNRKQNR